MRLPGYWPNETSGVLAPVVKAYVNGRSLTDDEVRLMQAYLRQWMQGGFRGPDADDLRRRVELIEDQEDLDHWIELALDAGIGPL